LVIVSSSAGGEPKQDTSESELKRLQGTWKVTRVVKNGQEMPAKDLTKESRVARVKDSILEFVSNGRTEDRFKLTLDTKADPRHIDLVEVDEKGNVRKIKKVKASTKGPPEVIGESDAKPVKGIYELRDDKLKLCLPDEEDERPKSFDSKAGASEMVLLELERVKN
jgi:uncharacterized protein (TIGR03067 family)